MRIHKKGIFVLVLAILVSNTAFAGMEDKLVVHWANNSIKKEFISYYLPYFARDDFSEFDPDKIMDRSRFALSTASLFKSKGYSVLGMESPGGLSRREMLRVLGSRLQAIGLVSDKAYNLDFVDIGSLSADLQDFLKILNKEKIVVGVGGGRFSPDKKLTQAEAVVLLQRLDSYLNRLNKINFVTKDVTNSYNSKEGIVISVYKDSIVLAITKQFPTPGYSISVRSISKQGNLFKVSLESKSPPVGSIQPQVIEYKTIHIEIDKTELGQGPYNFIVEDDL